MRVGRSSVLVVLAVLGCQTKTESVPQVPIPGIDESGARSPARPEGGVPLEPLFTQLSEALRGLKPRAIAVLPFVTVNRDERQVKAIGVEMSRDLAQRLEKDGIVRFAFGPDHVQPVLARAGISRLLFLRFDQVVLNADCLGVDTVVFGTIEQVDRTAVTDDTVLKIEARLVRPAGPGPGDPAAGPGAPERFTFDLTSTTPGSQRYWLQEKERSDWGDDLTPVSAEPVRKWRVQDACRQIGDQVSLALSKRRENRQSAVNKIIYVVDADMAGLGNVGRMLSLEISVQLTGRKVQCGPSKSHDDLLTLDCDLLVESAMDPDGRLWVVTKELETGEDFVRVNRPIDFAGSQK